MRENCTSGSMRGHRKRATSQRACVLLYERPSKFFSPGRRPQVRPEAARFAKCRKVGRLIADPLRKGITGRFTERCNEVADFRAALIKGVNQTAKIR